MNTRKKEFDFLKTIATILIICHHYQQVLSVHFRYANFFGGRFYFGYLVELFFIISGICAYRWIKTSLDKTFPKFYLARVRRLLPLVAISVIVDAGIICIFKYAFNVSVTKLANVSLKNIIISCLGMQAGWFFENPGINNPMWYVSVLLLCYIIMYFTTWLAKKMNITPYILYLFVIFIGVLIITLHLDYPFLNSYTYRGYLSFFWGLCLGKLYEKKNMQDIKVQLIALGMLILGVFLYFKGVYVGYVVVFLIWTAIIILVKSKCLEKLMNLNFWSKAARVSFSAYVWHTPFMHLIYGLIQKGFLQGVNQVLGMILVVIIVEMLAVISYKFIEKPIAKIIKK